MLQFINGFSCAMDQERGEMIINFVQQSPDFDDDGKVTIEEISSIVMGKVTAQKLLDSLNEMLNENE